MIDMLAPVFGHRPQDIPIKVVGARPGEKICEELSNDEESTRVLDRIASYAFCLLW